MRKSKNNAFKRLLSAMGKNWMESMRYYSYSL